MMRKYKDETTYLYLAIVIIGCSILVSGINFSILNCVTACGVSCFFIGTVLCDIFCKRNEFRYQLISYLLLVLLLIFFVITKIYGYSIWGNVQMTFILFIGPVWIWLILTITWIKKIFQIKILVFFRKLRYVDLSMAFSSTMFNKNF